MSRDISIQPITAASFAPFGDLLGYAGAPDKIINQGQCGRYHDRAQMDFSDGAAGISLFNAEPRSLPLKLEILERHPDGSQAFIPMAHVGFLVVVAPDVDGIPGTPLAFETKPGQAINFHRGVWHGVLTPLHAPGLFAVVDRIGAGENLEEHWLKEPWTITR
jgi:ureidoglycolate lyase